MREKASITVHSVRVFIALLILCGVSCAQSADAADPQNISLLIQQVKDLQQREQELMQRIQILEEEQKDQQTKATLTPSDASPAPPAPAAPASTLPPMHDIHGIEWRGFGEVNYKVLNQRVGETQTYGFVPGSSGNFYTGDFDLFLTSRLSEKSSVLAEIAFEEGDAQSFTVDLRRMLLRYDPNDHLRISLGRYQTNTGYYNWAFRSASWLQTTADRPLVMEFSSNGGLLPTQAVGVSVTGSIPSGKLGLNYVGEYGSSDTVRPDINGDGLLNDENNSNQINVGLFLNPDLVPGLRLGASIYHDQISDLVDSANGTMLGAQGVGGNIPPTSARWNQTIVNGHVVYVSRGMEFLNEGFLIRHAPIGGGETFHTPAFYSQFSKKIGPIRPFVRYQYVNASELNVIYNDVGLRAGPSFGARYDVSQYCAVKAQLDHTMRRGLPDLNGLHLQLTGTF